MLDVGHYFGVVEDRQIISSTGVHVYSTLYGVAAIVRKVRIPSRPVGEMSGPHRCCANLNPPMRPISLFDASSSVPIYRQVRKAGA